MIGVIIGVDPTCSINAAVAIRMELERRFPGVRFAVVPTAASLVFDFDDPADEVET